MEELEQEKENKFKQSIDLSPVLALQCLPLLIKPKLQKQKVPNLNPIYNPELYYI